VQRWLLALLCLAASLAYLTRQVESQADSPMLSMAAAPLTSMPGMNMSDHAGVAAPQAPPLNTAAPNAPPAPHQHAGHCPFCFAAAFALEAQWVTGPFRAAPMLTWVAPVYAHPDVLALRHADSRAPPKSPWSERLLSRHPVRQGTQADV
jgi:hypothetical protein